MTWIEAIQSRLSFSGPPERRSDSQIDADLDDEFAFHLEMKTRELMDHGHDCEAASGLARACFGDVELIKKRCKRIALEERIMLQRVNFVLMIVLALVVIGVGVQVFVTQRYNTLALQDITSQIAKMRLDAAAEAKDRGWNVPDKPQNPPAQLSAGDVVTIEVFELIQHNEWYRTTRMVEADGTVRLPMVGALRAAGRTPSEVEEELATRVATYTRTEPKVSLYVAPEASDIPTSAVGQEDEGPSVLVQGDVQRPGWYPIETKRGATFLSDVISLTQPLEDEFEITMKRRKSDGGLTHVDRMNAAQFRERGARVVLLPEYEISIMAASTMEKMRAQAKMHPTVADWDPKPGLWNEVDQNGVRVPNGATLIVIAANDIRNLSGEPVGRLEIDGEHLNLSFKQGNYANNVNLEIKIDQSFQGRWAIEGGDTLVLNISRALPAHSTPLKFKHGHSEEPRAEVINSR